MDWKVGSVLTAVAGFAGCLQVRSLSSPTCKFCGSLCYSKGRFSEPEFKAQILNVKKDTPPTPLVSVGSLL